MSRIVDRYRCEVKHPGGVIPVARFVFLNGRAAVWVEDRRARTADRLLFATDVTFEPGRTARVPNLVTLSDNTVWEVRDLGGGCGCGRRPFTQASMETLLSEDVDHLG